MAHLDESDAIVPGAEGFIDAVDPVTGQAEDRVDSPGDQTVD